MSIITITITMSIILTNFGKYAISDCPFSFTVYGDNAQLFAARY